MYVTICGVVLYLPILHHRPIALASHYDHRKGLGKNGLEIVVCIELQVIVLMERCRSIPVCESLRFASNYPSSYLQIASTSDHTGLHRLVIFMPMTPLPLCPTVGKHDIRIDHAGNIFISWSTQLKKKSLFTPFKLFMT